MQENTNTSVDLNDLPLKHNGVRNIYNKEQDQESRQFSGTTIWHSYLHSVIYTEGMKWFFDSFCCAWLLCEIALVALRYKNKEDFLTIEIKTHQPGSGVMNVTDGNEKNLASFKFDYMDLYVDPDVDLIFFLAFDPYHDRFVLMLRSEY
jgi:hypothetical protein